MKTRPGARASALAFLLLAGPGPALADSAGATALPDTLRLAPLQRDALLADPRQDRRGLDEEESELGVDRIGTRRLPQFTVLGEATVQSDVVDIPISAPGVSIALPPKDRYTATLHAELLLWDGGRNSAAQDVVRAGLGVNQARLDSQLHDVRWDVDAAFFQALVLQESLKETALMIEDLDARLEETQARVAAGSALRGDAALLEAEVLGVEQTERELRADRRAALDVLERLTGRTIADDAVLAEPRLAARVDAIVPALAATGRELPDSLRVHPRFGEFEQRELELDHRIARVQRDSRPTLSVFGDASYANPGMRQFDATFQDEWRGGVQLRWNPWDWGARSRQADELRVQLRRLDIERRSFDQALVRALQSPLRTLERLHDALEADDSIIELREVVADQSRVQFEERAIPAWRYVEARTDLSQARVDRAVHLAELARTRAHILMTLGMEID